MTLRDMNTVGMVAKHWECSTRTVQNRINEGSLSCLRLGGLIRLTRQQVEDYEKACTAGGKAEPEPSTLVQPGPACTSARRQRIEGVPSRFLRDRKPARRDE